MTLSNKSAGVFVAEVLGTMILAMMVLSMGLVSPFLIGLVLTVLVFTFGCVSGAHLNPAVTIAMAAARKIQPAMVVVYLVAQAVGAVLALGVFEYLRDSEYVATLDLASESTVQLFTAEALGAAILMIGVVLAVKCSDRMRQVSAFVVGLSFMVGIEVATIGGGGIINPAVAYSLGQLSLTTFAAPVVGAVAGMVVYKWLLQNSCFSKKK